MVVEQEYSSAFSLPYARPTAFGIASTADYAICHNIMHSASKNYSFASKVLPKSKAHHVDALYALLRVGDDRVDVSYEGFGSSLEAIDDWEQTYREAFAKGDSDHPVMRAYLNTAIECSIPERTLDTYFRAMRDDLTISRFPTFGDLLHYIDGSAIPVGRVMTHILGVSEPYVFTNAISAADSLSIAMQLSNFWRDIGEDWERSGRIYIPQENMEQFRYSEQDLANRRVDRRFIDLLEHLFDRTEQYYSHARDGIAMLESGQWAVMSGLEIYRAILFGIRRNQYDVFTQRAGTSRSRKVGLVIKSWWQVRQELHNQSSVLDKEVE